MSRHTVYRYVVTYREHEHTTEAAHHTILALNDDGAAKTLAEIRATCAAVPCNAVLSDSAGWAKGWVHADGTYTLR